jgi:hypothetical protein
VYESVAPTDFIFEWNIADCWFSQIATNYCISQKQEELMEQPEESLPSDEESKNSERVPLLARLQRAFGPLAGGMILDLVDLSTFGPFGIGGFFIGGLVGWWICSVYNVATTTRLTVALLSGVYCLLPLTEFIPVATMISAYIRFLGADAGRGE